MEISIETSLGELVDKITILEIKKLKIFEKSKLKLAFSPKTKIKEGISHFLDWYLDYVAR